MVVVCRVQCVRQWLEPCPVVPTQHGKTRKSKAHSTANQAAWRQNLAAVAAGKLKLADATHAPATTDDDDDASGKAATAAPTSNADDDDDKSKAGSTASTANGGFPKVDSSVYVPPASAGKLGDMDGTGATEEGKLAMAQTLSEMRKIAVGTAQLDGASPAAAAAAAAAGSSALAVGQQAGQQAEQQASRRTPQQAAAVAAAAAHGFHPLHFVAAVATFGLVVKAAQQGAGGNLVPYGVPGYAAVSSASAHPVFQMPTKGGYSDF
jgi:hypothetical protein